MTDPTREKAYSIPSHEIALHFARLATDRDHNDARADERCGECDRPLTYQERGLCIGCEQVEEERGR